MTASAYVDTSIGAFETFLMVALSRSVPFGRPSKMCGSNAYSARAEVMTSVIGVFGARSRPSANASVGPMI